MKILITGGTGMLGSELLRVVTEKGIECASLDRNAFLEANKDEKLSMLEPYNIIIHAAANTNVEQCELDPELCYFGNIFLTEKLFWAACRHEMKFVYISSTGVYGREKHTPYHEYDVTNPTTVHHRSKMLSERMVLGCMRSLVIRTGWLFGGRLDNKKNFVANRISEARLAKEFITANFQQIGSPTYVRDCARTILELILDDCNGIYNVVNESPASRYEYVRRIVELAGSPIEVRAVDSISFNRRADVSENEAAVSYRMRFEGRQQLDCWQDALANYMREYGLIGCLVADNKS